MYLYDEIDQRLVDERVRQFRDQTRRFLAGQLAEEEFRALISPAVKEKLHASGLRPVSFRAAFER